MEVVGRQSSVVGERLIQEERLAYGAPRGYRDLDVYKRSFTLLAPVHALVKAFPDYEKWDLAQQMRRAAKSIPANIAEGYALRDAPRLFCRHLRIAYGSAAEMRVHFDAALELGYISRDQHAEFETSYAIVAKQLYRLWQYWRRELSVFDEDKNG